MIIDSNPNLLSITWSESELLLDYKCENLPAAQKTFHRCDTQEFVEDVVNGLILIKTFGKPSAGCIDLTTKERQQH